MSQEVHGWYYLLGEELGRRKHLKVPAQQHGHDSDGSHATGDVANNIHERRFKVQRVHVLGERMPPSASALTPVKSWRCAVPGRRQESADPHSFRSESDSRLLCFAERLGQECNAPLVSRVQSPEVLLLKKPFGFR